MLWFPYIKALDSLLIYTVLALAAGVLTFVGIEMAEEVIEYSVGSGSMVAAGGIASFGFFATFGSMYWLSV